MKTLFVPDGYKGLKIIFTAVLQIMKQEKAFLKLIIYDNAINAIQIDSHRLW